MKKEDIFVNTYDDLRKVKGISKITHLSIDELKNWVSTPKTKLFYVSWCHIRYSVKGKECRGNSGLIVASSKAQIKDKLYNHTYGYACHSFDGREGVAIQEIVLWDKLTDYEKMRNSIIPEEYWNE